ncbi:MAG TPA: NAD(P)-dependent oxidoreductase [Patescibacteria group bacterium]|nr:NAD(P)-dependent oxidoreductase [Patescibacteria group bacterium]
MNDSYWKNKTVIVSGGLGFIGSHFVEELALLEANVVCLYRRQPQNLPIYKNSENVRYVQIDIMNYKEFETICKKIAPNIDAFIHCAALDGNTQFKLDHAAEILDTNNRLVSNVLNGCRHAQIPHVVLLSSAEVYSLNTPSSISEEDDYHKYFSFTDNGYVLSKIFSEIMSEFYYKQHNMQIYVPRPTNVYGPRDSFEVTANRVIPAMIRKVSDDKTIEIWGDGKQTRSFIYVKDLVHTTLIMIEKNIVGPLNIATKDQVSILDLASYISKEYDTENPITLNKTKPVGVKGRLLDVSKMYDIINFEPLSIQEGLKRTIAWYTSNSMSK